MRRLGGGGELLRRRGGVGPGGTCHVGGICGKAASDWDRSWGLALGCDPALVGGVAGLAMARAKVCAAVKVGHHAAQVWGHRSKSAPIGRYTGVPIPRGGSCIVARH
jgi:hypothetical protein